MFNKLVKHSKADCPHSLHTLSTLACISISHPVFCQDPVLAHDVEEYLIIFASICKCPPPKFKMDVAKTFNNAPCLKKLFQGIN